ncbi:hypothetical protein B0O99DRAFT_508321 [Bisporella sp. PMI_857]|nr:hypothetical protein B0O99DRAFT_508321 [Bisporella sp. PMI_857]
MRSLSNASSVSGAATSALGSSSSPIKEPPMILSTWGIGWQTPLLMLGPYIFALALAVAHLLIFQYLDGKEADGLNAIFPQTYVSTTSNIIANVFGFSLRAALAVAFVQYLWYLLRAEAMKVSTIELLFSIRSNLFVFFQPAALRATPVLFMLALLMWLSQIVISFPPGAITVSSTQRIFYKMIEIPTFNASFIGNGSGIDADRLSLQVLVAEPPIGFSIGQFNDNRNTNLINRLARQLLNSGETLATPSPCGPNCTYNLDFEGPWMTCTTSNTTKFLNSIAPPYPIYQGEWTSAPTASRGPSRYNGTYTLANFNSTTLTPVYADRRGTIGYANGTLLVQADNIICSPGRATFKVNNTYNGNVLTRFFTVTPNDKLINLAITTYHGTVKVPGMQAAAGYGFGTTPANWSNDALAYYRDQNIMTIFSSMMSWLNGSFMAYPVSYEPSQSSDLNDTMTNLAWREEITTTSTGLAYRASARNGTIIDSTRFNTAFGQYAASTPAPPSFNITQDLINEYLFNLTLSIMTAYGQWKTTVNATQSISINIYTFSQPLNLILPYFISLGITLPFIFVGFLALLKNGVSATDGSFMQIITTSTGSAILDRAAAGGCLGGDESVPKELKDLRIKFGEIISRGDPGTVKRAGFGAEGEVTNLRKGEKYGIARWI